LFFVSFNNIIINDTGANDGMNMKDKYKGRRRSCLWFKTVKAYFLSLDGPWDQDPNSKPHEYEGGAVTITVAQDLLVMSEKTM
jgi:hypothetical protein